MKKKVLIVIMLVIMLEVFLPEIKACTCNIPSDREKYKDAKAVFIGEVKDIIESIDHDFPLIVKFNVEKQWKGNIKSDFELFFIPPIPVCPSLYIKKGEKYLIYCYSKKGKLYFQGNCSPSLPIVKASSQLNKLNNPFYRLFVRIFPF